MSCEEVILKNQFTAAMGGMLVFGIMLSFSIGRSKVDYKEGEKHF